MSNPSQNLALSRMMILFEQAKDQFSKRPDRSRRYVQLAQKIQQRYRVKMPIEMKEQFCPKCESFLVIGKNAKKRVKVPHQNITCGECGFVHSFRLSEKKTEGKKTGMKK